jgi:hypothetical protein
MLNIFSFYCDQKNAVMRELITLICYLLQLKVHHFNMCKYEQQRHDHKRDFFVCLTSELLKVFE